MEVVKPGLQGNASGVMNAIRPQDVSRIPIQRDQFTPGTRVCVRRGSPQEPGVARDVEGRRSWQAIANG